MTAEFGHQVFARSSCVATAELAIYYMAIHYSTWYLWLFVMAMIVAGLVICMAAIGVRSAGMGEGINGHKNCGQQENQEDNKVLFHAAIPHQIPLMCILDLNWLNKTKWVTVRKRFHV